MGKQFSKFMFVMDEDYATSMLQVFEQDKMGIKFEYANNPDLPYLHYLRLPENYKQNENIKKWFGGCWESDSEDETMDLGSEKLSKKDKKWIKFVAEGKDKYVCSNCNKSCTLPKYGWTYKYRCRCDVDISVSIKYCSKKC